MKRIRFLFRVKQGIIEVYKVRYASVRPEMQAPCGVRAVTTTLVLGAPLDCRLASLKRVTVWRLKLTQC